ncbi:MAG: hypothetical protein JWO89_1222, partial [Verrucomicrobiaceae bacterium]|nr:hypothetical protein [Verrucomicrobiaceae bacterium]
LLSYHSSGQDFGFEIKDPRAMFGGLWTYDMESHEWEDRGD